MTAPRPTTELGRQGEELARAFLEDLGYAFIGRNWYCRAGEIDLIMRDGDELVFVEVKTRHGEGAGRAEDAVSRSKARKMLNAGEWYITTHAEHQDRFWRCDLVAITLSPVDPPEVAHFVNAIVIG